MKTFKEVSKYLKYSDLMKAYAVSFAKDGGLGPESKKIKAAMDKERKKLGIKEDTKPVPYWTWNNKKIGEGTMSSGIFDSDNKKAKDAARKFAMFLKQNKKVTIENDPENPKKDHKDLQAYTKELMNYIFDDRMLDDLDPSNKKTNGKKANDIVTKRLKELGVKIR